jgi:hypothetical protein
MEKKVICAKCKKDLEIKKVIIQYFDHEFRKDVPCCPVCNQAYISYDFATGQVREAEMELEDK